MTANNGGTGGVDLSLDEGGEAEETPRNKGGRPVEHGLYSAKAARAAGKPITSTDMRRAMAEARTALERGGARQLLADELIFAAAMPRLLRRYIEKNPAALVRMTDKYLRALESLRRAVKDLGEHGGKGEGEGKQGPPDWMNYAEVNMGER